MRVDDLEIGEIYRVSEDELQRVDVVEVQYENDRFMRFGHTGSMPQSSSGEPKVVFTSRYEELYNPLVYIGTKRSRMYTHESVEHAHVFASVTGQHYCVLGRHIKHILPFPP